jgi:hypothetical protein
MPIVLIIAIVAALVIILFLIAVASRPAHFRIARAATIGAPLATVHANIDDFHRWQQWSPWAKLDPAAKATFDGPASGLGAAFAWDGNSKVGAGRMTITDATPTHIRIRLEFARPFTATNTADFTLSPDGPATQVTWAMSGPSPFFLRAMCMLFFNQEKMVGGMFEEGLANLKKLSETPA